MKLFIPQEGNVSNSNHPKENILLEPFNFTGIYHGILRTTHIFEGLTAVLVLIYFLILLIY